MDCPSFRLTHQALNNYVYAVRADLVSDWLQRIYIFFVSFVDEDRSVSG